MNGNLHSPVMQNDALLTDLYQLTMLQAYLDEGFTQPAVFEFFVRKLPPQRNFLVAGGLESVLDYLGRLRFAAEELDWLARTGRFRHRLLDYLENFRFTGDVHAMPEGTPFFAEEPILRVTAPMPEAQLVESRLINLLHVQTLLASKAVRCVLAAPGKQLVEFGLRRSHGAEAALWAARSSYLVGFAGTANVLAGRLWNIPIYGTMAHSYIQAHDDEAQSFVSFAEANPGNVVWLLDTYDTQRAAEKAVALAPQLKAQGITLAGVRLDSGDLAEHARRVRGILDEGGLDHVTIFASGNLDEWKLAELTAAGAPIDAFGVGTRVDVAADAPYLDCAYKLQEYAGLPRRKRSEGKATWPGRKQVFRLRDDQGLFLSDIVTLESEPAAGQPLLVPVMQQGVRCGAGEPLTVLRTETAENLARLPQRLRRLQPAEEPYAVEIAQPLRDLARALDQR